MVEALRSRGVSLLVKDASLAQPNDAAWCRSNSIAMMMLLTSVSEVADLGDKDVAHEAWANLNSMRASRSIQGQLNNLTALFALTYTSGGVVKYAQQLHLILAVNEAGMSMPELVGIGLLVERLPEPFSGIIRHAIAATASIATEEQRLNHLAMGGGYSYVPL
jgi:hypothetical protein